MSARSARTLRAVLWLGLGMLVGAGGVRLLSPQAPDGPARLDLPGVHTPRAASGPVPLASMTIPADAAVVPATAVERFDALLDEPAEFTQTAALYALAAAVDRDGLEALLDAAERVPQASERAAAAGILYARYAELDAPAAVAHVLARSEPETGAWLATVFRTWARLDPAAAGAGVRELPAGARLMAARAVLSAREDWSPAFLETLAEELDAGHLLAELDAARQRRSISIHPAADWQRALAISDAGQRATQLWRISQFWAQADPRAAMNAVSTLPPDSGTVPALQNRVLAVWAERNPSEALRWVLEEGSDAARPQHLRRVLQPVAARDVAEALSLTRGLAGEDRENALAVVVPRWAEQDPTAAAGWLLSEPALAKDVGLVAAVAGHYGAEDPGVALRWAEQLPARESREIATQQVLQRLATDDPQQAIRLSETVEDLKLRERLQTQAVMRWAAQDAQAVLRWSMALDDDDRRARVRSQIVQQLAAEDPDRALRIYDGLPAGGSRDAAAYGLIGRLAADPERDYQVERVFDELKDDAYRRAAAQLIYQHWSGRDPGRAARYRDIARPEDA